MQNHKRRKTINFEPPFLFFDAFANLLDPPEEASADGEQSFADPSHRRAEPVRDAAADAGDAVGEADRLERPLARAVVDRARGVRHILVVFPRERLVVPAVVHVPIRAALGVDVHVVLGVVRGHRPPHVIP